VLRVEDLTVAYGGIKALKGVSFRVDEGEIVALIGANGAGKSTTLRTISGLVKASGGKVEFKAQNLLARAPHEVVGLGISHVPEGRRIFANLTVLENLELGAYLRIARRMRKEVAEDLERVYALFPRLRERQKQLAGTLSGGEQQMLAIGRALMARGRLMLLDEPSMGLAPLLVQEIFRVLGEINRHGTTILLVEQNAFMALRLAHRGYVLQTGEVVLSGPASDLAADPAVQQAYLGR
jgi:branched-chain amino acid transport system ATP-binding protein